MPGPNSGKTPDEMTYPNWDLLVIDPNMKPIANLKMVFHVDGKEIPFTTSVDGKVIGIPRSDNQIQIDATYKGKKEKIVELNVKPEDSIDKNLVTLMSPFILVKRMNAVHDGEPSKGSNVQSGPKPTPDTPVIRARDEGGHPKLQVGVPGSPLTDEQREAISKSAHAWFGTPYGHPDAPEGNPARDRPYGTKSKNQVGADCNGTVWGVYRDAGIPYNDFVTHATIGNNAHWRITTDPKIGDVVRWKGHLAIYAGNGNIWTAHNMNSPKGFSEMEQKYMRPGQNFEYYEFINP